MCCELYALVREFFFVRETQIDINSLPPGIDEDTVKKNLFIQAGSSSTDFFDFSMYLYDCPPERIASRLPFKFYLPCKELENKKITESDISCLRSKVKLDLLPPIRMSFRFDPVKESDLVNMHHFTLFFQDSAGHEYKRNGATSSEKNLARHFIAKWLWPFVIRNSSDCKAWNREDDPKLFAFSNVKLSLDSEVSSQGDTSK
jgi:hypothetical protein